MISNSGDLLYVFTVVSVVVRKISGMFACDAYREIVNSFTLECKINEIEVRNNLNKYFYFFIKVCCTGRKQ